MGITWGLPYPKKGEGERNVDEGNAPRETKGMEGKDGMLKSREGEGRRNECIHVDSLEEMNEYE